MKVELTERQREILEYIKQKLDVDRTPPTVQEIQSQFSFRSPNAVQTHLLALTKKGYVWRRGRQARGLRLVEQTGSANDNGEATLLAPPLVTVTPAPHYPVYPSGGAQPYHNGNGGAALELQPLVASAPSEHGEPDPTIESEGSVIPIAAPAQTKLEMGVDVFFNARHVIADELGGELHAHSWRLRVVVLTGCGANDPGVSAGEVRQVVQEMVDDLDGLVLNNMEPFLDQEPTLERMCGWLGSQINDQLVTLDVKLRSLTLWDQPTQYVTVSE